MNYVYRIEVNGKYYIGSTGDMKERFCHHKSDCFNGNYNGFNYKIYKFIRSCEITFDTFCEKVNHKIICYIPNKKDLKKYEQMFINLLDPLCLNDRKENQNRNNPDGTPNKDYDKKYSEEYRKNNPEKIKENNEENNDKRSKEKITCDCGGKYQYASKSTHFKRNIHINYISKLKEIL